MTHTTVYVPVLFILGSAW